jgi:hypothetical protein
MAVEVLFDHGSFTLFKQWNKEETEVTVWSSIIPGVKGVAGTVPDALRTLVVKTSQMQDVLVKVNAQLQESMNLIDNGEKVWGPTAFAPGAPNPQKKRSSS